MNPVQEEVPKPGGVRSGSTLLEEMKILEEIQGQTGMKKTLNSELWHACAGPLVSLPQIGSLVYYFPQGHSEQVAISTRRPTNTHIPNYPILPSQLLCQVLNITLHADRDTDEIYAQVTLQPINSEKDILPASNFRQKQSKHPSEFFCKTLTASDTSTHGGFSVPRRAAEKLFPTLDYAMQPPTQELVVRDLHDNSWTFRHIYRGQPRRHLLTTGWSLFVGGKRLRAGDSVLFIRDEKSQLLLGVRCSNRQQTAFSSSVLSADSMHMGVLAAAAHAAANRSPFTVFYNPRACPSEFIVPLAKYHKSVYGTQVSAGMRFGMMFETEESSKRRFLGTVVGISDLDPIRWPNSKWRSVQVEWDELGNGERPSKVCLWEIETPECPFICPTPVSNLKRTLPPAFSDYGWDNVLKRSLGRFSGRGNTGLQYPLLQNLGSDFMKVLANQPLSLPPDPPIELMEASILQTLRSTELNRTLPSPLSSLPVQDLGIPALSQQTNQHSLLEDLLSQDQNSQNYQHFLPFCGSSVVSHLGIQTQENVIDELPFEQKKEDLPNKHDEKPDIVHKDPTASHSPSILSVLVQKGTNCNTMPLESTEEKCICSPLNRQNLLSQMYPDQDLSLLSLSLETNNLNTLLSFTGHQFPPYGDTSDWMLQPNSSQSLNSMFMSPESLSAINKPAPFLLSPSVNTSSILDAPSSVSLEVTNTKESHHILSTSTSTGSQEFGCLQQLTCPRFPSEFKDFSEDSINQSEGYSSLQFEADTSVSQSGLEAFYTVKGTKGQNHSECPSGLYTASQDVQSQITSRSLSNSQPFSVQDFPDDNSGGTSSSHGEGDGHFMQQGMLQQVSPPFRTYTKVQKLGSVGRSIDATRFSNYNELKSAIACMFGIQGQLDDPRGSAWKLVYVDYENDVLLVGDDPWEEFVRCVRCIRILSPSEVQKMSEEGMQILNGTINQGEEFVA